MTYSKGEYQLTFKDSGLMDIALAVRGIERAADSIKKCVLSMYERAPRSNDSYMRQYMEWKKFDTYWRCGDFTESERELCPPEEEWPQPPSWEGLKFDEAEEKSLMVNIEYIYRNIGRVAEWLWENNLKFPYPNLIIRSLGNRTFNIKDNFCAALVDLDGTYRMFQPFQGFKIEMFPHEVQYCRFRRYWKWICNFLPSFTFQPEDLIYDDDDDEQEY